MGGDSTLIRFRVVEWTKTAKVGSKYFVRFITMARLRKKNAIIVQIAPGTVLNVLCWL